MPLDASIITNMQQPDFTQALTNGVNMRAMAQQTQMRQMELQRAQRENADAVALRNAQDNNTTIGPDGAPTYDSAGTLKDLASTAPHLVPQVQMQMAQQSRDMQAAKLKSAMDQHDFIGRLAGAATDQQSWDNSLQTAKAAGLDTSQLPAQFDPNVRASLMAGAMSAKDQLEAQAKQQGLNLQNKEANIKTQELGLSLRKDSATQNQETLSALQALRGNPALQRAETNVLSAKNLTDLAEQGRDPNTGKIDLNKLNPQQVSLWNHELLRMASGGSGSETDLENLKPGTPQYKMAELRQKLTGNVSGAQAGPYLQQSLDYANALGQSSNQFLYQNAKHVVDAKRNYLAPQDQAKYDSWLSNMKSGNAYFGDGVSNAAASTSGASSGKASKSQQPATTASAHPQDSVAIQWAQNNPKDPRAAKILQANGVVSGVAGNK